MSAMFAQTQRGAPRPPPDPKQIQRILEENGHLIATIQDYQSKGKPQEVVQMQSTLHRNLVFLATIADSAQNVNSLLPVSVNFFYKIEIEIILFLDDTVPRTNRNSSTTKPWATATYNRSTTYE